jgi:hypothetical protein
MATDYTVQLLFLSVCSPKYPMLLYAFPLTNLFIHFLQVRRGQSREKYGLFSKPPGLPSSSLTGRNFQAPSPFHCPRISYEQTFEQKKHAATSSSSTTARHGFNQIEVSRFYLFSPSVYLSLQKGSSHFLLAYIYIYIYRYLSLMMNGQHINFQPAVTIISINFPSYGTPHSSSVFHTENQTDEINEFKRMDRH